jgi:hypothetical protein
LVPPLRLVAVAPHEGHERPMGQVGQTRSAAS